ncbi:hypothetical protein OHA25_12020 [Nonomuraea sp. NBC_00507]|uniref:hypothetical protein n=1 Tax=Nonomuraea sp. NBC_00507 TaxID=2976002 RepID=UPI002E19F8A9
MNPLTKCRKTEERVLIGGGSQGTTTIQQGKRGPEGPQGPKGDPGSGATYTTYTKTASLGSLGPATASCHFGGVATGGGFSFAVLKNAVVMGSAPSGNGTGWTVSVAKDDNGIGNNSSTQDADQKTSGVSGGNHGTSVSGTVYVVCMKKQ